MNQMRGKAIGRSSGLHKTMLNGWAAVAAIVIVGLLFAARPGPLPSDDQQIRDALSDGALAIQRHDIPALLQFVSKDYKDDAGMNRDRIRFALAQVLRDHDRIWVDPGNPAIRLEGATATVTSDVTVEVFDKGMSESDRTTRPVTLRFRKEPGRRFLLFPVDHWRVIEASGAGLSDQGDAFGL